jgi:hypothetical protein
MVGTVTRGGSSPYFQGVVPQTAGPPRDHGPIGDGLLTTKMPLHPASNPHDGTARPNTGLSPAASEVVDQVLAANAAKPI